MAMNRLQSTGRLVDDEMNTENSSTFHELEWDTEFFNVTCAKAILHEPISMDEWKNLKEKFNNYQFVSIENRYSESLNAQLIGKETAAFLADVNIQFSKKLDSAAEKPIHIAVYNNLIRDDHILRLADFKHSKFTEDPELAKRRGHEVYEQWIINAFNRPDKYFALSQTSSGDIDGFLLFSFSDSFCTVELIAALKNKANNGIGTSLFKMAEYEAMRHGINEIKVGTQMRNTGAINFYHKLGCKQVGCHQIYHLWRL